MGNRLPPCRQIYRLWAEIAPRSGKKCPLERIHFEAGCVFARKGCYPRRPASEKNLNNSQALPGALRPQVKDAMFFSEAHVDRLVPLPQGLEHEPRPVGASSKLQDGPLRTQTFRQRPLFFRGTSEQRELQQLAGIDPARRNGQGEIRIVGNALPIASRQSDRCEGCGSDPRAKPGLPRHFSGVYRGNRLAPSAGRQRAAPSAASAGVRDCRSHPLLRPPFGCDSLLQ